MFIRSTKRSQPIKAPSVDPNFSASRSSKKSKAGVIAGALIGALVGVGGAILAVFFYIRRRRQRREQMNYVTSEDPKVGLASPLGFSEGVTYEPYTGEQMGSLVHDPHTFSDSTYSNGRYSQDLQGQYGPGISVTSTELGPSASQVGDNTTLSYTTGDSSGMAATSHRSGRAGSSNTSMAKQSMVNEELRNEVDNLRREMERIRQERVDTVDEAPPSYTDVS